MAKSIYGFAKSAASGGTDSSAVTDAIRTYNIYLAQQANEDGVINNPDAYQEARKILEPYKNDLRAQDKIVDSINNENKLRVDLKETQYSRSVYEEDVENQLSTYAKQYYKSPETLIATTAYTYNVAIDDLQQEIERRRVNGEAYGELVSLQNKYEKKAREITRLSRSVMLDEVDNPNAYGWFVETNPDDGSIVSMRVSPVNDIDRSGDYFRTDTRYGEIPVWTKPVPNEDGDMIARVGMNQYELEVDQSTGSKILELKGKGWGNYLKALIPGGENKMLDLSNLEFSGAANLPQGSVTKDVSGNYYYYGSDGVYKANDKNMMEKYLRMEGIPTQDVDSMAYPVTRQEVQNYGPFTEEDGTSRIIDEEFLGGVTSKRPQQGSGLPPVSQEVRGEFSTKSGPDAGLGSVGAESAGPQPFQVPRKEPGLSTREREVTSSGQVSAEDVIADENEEIFNPSGLGR